MSVTLDSTSQGFFFLFFFSFFFIPIHPHPFLFFSTLFTPFSWSPMWLDRVYSPKIILPRQESDSRPKGSQQNVAAVTETCDSHVVWGQQDTDRVMLKSGNIVNVQIFIAIFQSHAKVWHYSQSANLDSNFPVSTELVKEILNVKRGKIENEKTRSPLNSVQICKGFDGTL